MQISLRSQMIAGVAAVGATAMAITPIAQPDLLNAPQRVSSAVDLAAFANPVEVLLSTVVDTSLWIFDQASLPDPADLYWPDNFYTPDFSFVFAPGYIGLIPDFVNQFSFGGLSAVVSNLSGYVSAGIRGVTDLVGGPITAVTNLPFALITAAGYLAAGQPDLAIAELQTQILGPLQAGITGALGAAGYIIDNVIANATTLITNAIPGLVGNLITTITNGAVYVGQSAITTLSTAVTALLAGQFETAWNTAVNGLLGPEGTLGQLEQLVVGVGIIEPVDYDPDPVVDTVIIPSLRSDFTTAGQRLGDLSQYGDGGIRNDAYFPAPTAAVSAPAAVEAAQAVDVEVERPAAGSADESEAAGDTEADVTAADSGSQSADASAASTAAGSDAGTEGSARGGSSENTGPAKAKASRGSARGAGSAS